ncbi:universal stress protein [Lapillicoccus sp.]|uniref:universal stress protein n=1 Tax=Lapillicoccus sp. TaxID=1909287 RepID=UPI0025FB895D|nr:universal stress protein [Lapillicoccus sp.]
MTIVVGYVPTKEGRAALRRAVQECLARGIGLVVVNTVRPGKSFDAEASSSFDEELRSLSGQLAAAGLTHEIRESSTTGDAAEDLIAVADELNAEAIVIGLRRRTPVGKLILGSNAQKILLDASCPVLAVKAGPEG